MMDSCVPAASEAELARLQLLDGTLQAGELGSEPSAIQDVDPLQVHLCRSSVE
jgi:hypothetical protein